MRAVVVASMALLLYACAQAPVTPPPAAAVQTAPTPPPPPAYPPPAPPKAVTPDKDHPLVRIDTNLGSITVQLDHQRARLSVDNFLHYVRSHYYDNTSFYRIVPGFVIQGGDFTADYKDKPTDNPAISNESGNGLSNGRGTIAFARGDDAHSATSSFYINLVDNGAHLGPRGDRWGYAVFGIVVEGLDVVDKIAAVPNGPVPTFDKKDTLPNAPLTPVTILKVTELPLAKP
ncbi:MAG TPA: peptidylprolyl isomerase [Gammaproteobacteria bacterium]|nr:peptidylprolyl isomerase [Gammaproteobacteria bacterium]